MSHDARTARRMLAGMVAGALALSVTPILGFTGVASAQEEANPLGAGNFCEDVPQSEPFSDITSADPAFGHIVCVVATEITVGFPDGTYRPNAPTQRRQMALFLTRLADEADRLEVSDNIEELPAYDGTPDFSDHAAEAADQEAAIGRLNQAGIASGFPDGTYRPGAPVSRRQMATFIYNLYDFLTGAPLPVSVTDHFSDDNGDSAGQQARTNAVAEAGIFIGNADGTFGPNTPITRRQMARVMTRTLQVLFEEGEITQWAAGSNQSFTIAPAGPLTDDIGTSRTFTVTDLDGATAVDIALIPCDEVIRNASAISFGDNEGDANEADDLGSTPVAHLDRVNNVSVPDTDHVNDASVVNGQVTFRVTSDTAGCIVAVVFDDLDDQNDLDLDASDQPTEPFAVTGNLTYVAIDAADATPETDTNPFGTQHTITVQLRDASSAPVPVQGRSIRFQVYRDPLVCDPDSDVVGGLTVAVTGSGVTGAAGSVALTYTGPTNPTAGDDPDVEDCIVVWLDADNDSTRDVAELDDVVSKTWSDDPPTATTVSLSPASDTNLVSTNHTVTATLFDQYGNPIPSQPVTFEVHREGAANPISSNQVSTNAGGQASLTYGGPSTQADDVIIVCRDTEGGGNGCDAVATFDPEGATLDAGEVDALAVKRWYELQATPDSGTNACVDAADTAADTIDVSDADVNRRLRYDSGDQFTVDGSAANLTAFETALSAGDRLTYSFQPTVADASTFALINDSDCTP